MTFQSRKLDGIKWKIWQTGLLLLDMYEIAPQGVPAVLEDWISSVLVEISKTRGAPSLRNSSGIAYNGTSEDTIRAYMSQEEESWLAEGSCASSTRTAT